MSYPVVLYVSTPTYINTDPEMTALYLQLRPHLGAAMMLVTPGVEGAEIMAGEWWRAHGMPEWLKFTMKFQKTSSNT